MANRNWASGGKIYSMFTYPVLIDCNFIVDSTNANELGIRDLKGPTVTNVFMQGQEPGPSPPPFSPILGASSTMGILAASTITNTGFTVVTGDIGLFAGTSVVGFPPGVVTGTQHITDATAQQAQIDASAAYTDLSTRPSTVIASALDGQTLTAGVYSFASGAATLAASGNGTLTFSGSATDVFVIQTASTLDTGAGGIPTITLTGGALASNIYWAVGSSATINIGVTSAGAEFKGTVIAQASVTDTQGGIVTGRLIALTAAVTLSAATAINVPSESSPTQIPGTPAPGTIVVQLADNYSRLLKMFKAIISPVSGTALKIDDSELTAGVTYVISTLGNSTATQWRALGLPPGVTPAVGVSFIANSVGAGADTSTSRVMTSALGGSNVASIELMGNPDLSLSPDSSLNQGFGAQFILQTRDYQGAIVAPTNESRISLSFLLSNSSVTLQGE